MTLRKGQTSIEMIMSIMFVLFILIIIALFANERTKEANAIQLRLDAKRVCISLADNINNIAEQGPGFYRYFSLPETVYGVTEYNLTVYRDFVEVSTQDYTWSTQTVTSNVTTFCLDKGSFKRNKVYDEGGLIYIICNKPELIYVNGSAWLTYSNASLWPPNVYTNQSVNLSIKVMNYGPVDSGPFWVRFNGTTATAKKVERLRSEEITEIAPFNMTTPLASGNFSIWVEIDYNNSVNESIEPNNNFNITLNAIQRP
jgi:hypothetical protein